MVAIPHQIVKSAPTVTRIATGMGLSATMNSITQGGLIGRAAGTFAKGSLFVAKHTENVAQVAGTLMKAPTIGRIFSPPVADVMTRKVLPTANAIGAGIAILDNSNRLYKANQANNTAGQVVAGSQIALNLTSAVTGYLPGKFQLISAAAGLGGLALEIAHQAGGLGK
ncbi:MAG: hypothetical protein CVV27_20300 [Candidatus Melainabacteria bacterium HGW-Melainabacteria-1]|nr:MAG: hypothetical protein CVV27_20300 [Candidatus Melainabacteria bacterium HGW-Melainabacteria-1]